VTGPRILVTNDDGIFSEGIERLAAALRDNLRKRKAQARASAAAATRSEFSFQFPAMLVSAAACCRVRRSGGN